MDPARERFRPRVLGSTFVPATGV